MSCFYYYCACQKARHALTEEGFQRGTKKRVMDELGKQCNERKGYTVVEMWECEVWKLYKLMCQGKTLETIISIQLSIASGAVNRQSKLRRIVGLRTV